MQWEYAIVMMTGRDRARVTFVADAADGRKRKNGREDNQYKLLADLGREGWEVCAPVVEGRAWGYMLKRPIAPEPVKDEGKKGG